MSSLVGHLLAGFIAAGAVRSKVAADKYRPLAAASAALALAPDLDVFPAMLNEGAGHRGFSHAPIFLIIAAVLAARLLEKYRGVPRASGITALTLAALSHPLLDYLMGCGPAVAFFQPFYQAGYLFPLRLLPTAYYPTAPRGLLQVFLLPQTYIGVMLEAAIFLPLLILASPRKTMRVPALLITSAAALAVSVMIYN